MPLSGSYRVSFSMLSYVNSTETNIGHLYHNDVVLEESRHKTHSSSGMVASTGGRELTVEASAGDSISLKTSTMDGDYWRVMTCFEFLPKIVKNEGKIVKKSNTISDVKSNVEGHSEEITSSSEAEERQEKSTESLNNTDSQPSFSNTGN